MRQLIRNQDDGALRQKSAQNQYASVNTAMPPNQDRQGPSTTILMLSKSEVSKGIYRFPTSQPNPETLCTDSNSHFIQNQ